MAYLDTVRTAKEVVAANNTDEAQNDLDAAAAAAAQTAGVTASEYVDYETKLTNYQSRDDVEGLPERRARDLASDVADQKFRRQGTGSIAVFTSPKDQNVGDGNLNPLA